MSEASKAYKSVLKLSPNHTKAKAGKDTFWLKQTWMYYNQSRVESKLYESQGLNLDPSQQGSQSSAFGHPFTQKVVHLELKLPLPPPF